MENNKTKKAEFSTLTSENVLVPSEMDMSTLGEVTHNFIKKMTAEYVAGPRRFEDVPVLDGARAFARAVEIHLGNELTAVGMGNSITIDGVEHVHTTTWGGKFTRSMLEDPKCISDRKLKEYAEEFNIEVPLNVETSRMQLAEQLSAVAPIVGLSPREFSAVIGHVNLTRNGKAFGEAMLADEDGDFSLMIKSTNQYATIVSTLIQETEKQIASNSVYKGLPYDYSSKKFLHDLDFDSVDRIALSSDISTRVRAEVANRLNNETRAMLDKRTATKSKSITLAHGEGGVGKTETARALGAYAVKNRRAFLIYMPDKVDVSDFKKFLEFAAKVGPAFVLIEDIEKMIDTQNPVEYSQMLEVLDGVTSKSKSIDIWINSNNAGSDNNEFRNTFLRRVDTYIDYDRVTDMQLQSLFAIYLDSNWELHGEIKYTNDMFDHDPLRIPDEQASLHPKMERLVAFVREYDFRPWAVAQTISKANGYVVDQRLDVITEEVLLSAAKSVVDLNNLVQRSDGTPKKTITMDTLVEGAVTTVLQDTGIVQKS